MIAKLSNPLNPAFTWSNISLCTPISQLAQPTASLCQDYLHQSTPFSLGLLSTFITLPLFCNLLHFISLFGSRRLCQLETTATSGDLVLVAVLSNQRALRSHSIDHQADNMDMTMASSTTDNGSSMTASAMSPTSTEMSGMGMSMGGSCKISVSSDLIFLSSSSHLGVLLILDFHRCSGTGIPSTHVIRLTLSDSWSPSWLTITQVSSPPPGASDPGPCLQDLVSASSVSSSR